MKLNLTDFLFAMSYALDAVEKEVNGAKTGHGERVAYMLFQMLQPLNLSKQEQIAYVGCAILHDNGLTQYQRGEAESLYTEVSRLGLHTELGEKNISQLSFGVDVQNIILHHHENINGSGPLGLHEKEIHFISHLLHIADVVELACDFETMTKEEFGQICQKIQEAGDVLLSKRAVDLFLECVTYDDVLFMRNKNFTSEFHKLVPDEIKEYEDEKIYEFAGFFMKLVDYKSSFTKDHSVGIAKKAFRMAEYYQFPHDKAMRFYFAGALHDIGKMAVANQILEKPGKLDVAEFERMKTHAKITYEILNSIEGFDDIAQWGGNHHEKLDGMGYPRGLHANQLTFEDRLMACIDIFQALTEVRPYKKNMSSAKAIMIMRDMVQTGKIDGTITEDIAKVFCSDEEMIQLQQSGKEKQWRCEICGYVHEGEYPPQVSPICDSTGAFKEKTVEE